MNALLEAYKAGLLKSHHWWPNIVAGLIVGIVALPLAMAFAIASGVKPEQGLYTAIIAGLVVGIFGGSRVQIAGPTGAFVVILASITARFGVEGLQLATLLAGFMLLLMGLFKLGNAIKYIPDPVVVGFTSGIGVIIFVSEWKDFFGLSVNIPLNAHFHEKIINLLQTFPSIHLATTSLAVLALLLVIFSNQFVRRIPGPLVAMLVVTILQAVFKFEGVATIGSVFGGIPHELPRFQLPQFSFNQALELIGPAFAIALLGAIESLLSAVVADGIIGTRHDANQELIGQGFANIACPLFGGFAATGAIARTATSVRNGGSSPLAAIIHSITLILIIVLLAPLASYIPLCALAAILFVVAYNMSEAHHFIHILKKAPRNDILVLLTTFLLTVFTDLVVAVNVGVILAIILFVRRMSQSVAIELEDHTTLSANGFKLPQGTMVYTIQGPFFFAAAETLERTLEATHADPKVIVFRLKQVPFMDMTGLKTFYELIAQFKKRGVKIYLCEANPRVTQKLKNMDILELVETGQVFASLSPILSSIQTNQ